LTEKSNLLLADKAATIDNLIFADISSNQGRWQSWCWQFIPCPAIQLPSCLLFVCSSPPLEKELNVRIETLVS
jgi:hypothetical protein